MSLNQHFGSSWQKEIYLRGFAGKRPLVPVEFEKLERAAEAVMTPEAYAYIAGGAGNESTMRSNCSAFQEWNIVPRMLRDVSSRDTRISLFGQALPAPILLAPIGVLEMAHPDADAAVGRAAAACGLPYIFSNQASRPMEEVAGVMGNSPRWFQLYWSKSNDLVASFVQRAERSDCSAIVVTLDTTLLGWRTRDLDMACLPFLEGMGIAQYTSDPVFTQLLHEVDQGEPIRQKINWSTLRGLIGMVNRYPGSGFVSKLRSSRPMKSVRKFVNIYSNPGLTWEQLPFLRQHTQLPILLKGILHPDDARKAVDLGMDGLIVSNHGGRQVDGAIATLRALPAIAEAVNKQVPVLMDSGVRGGADIFKALALGATAVCVGRPYVYGLAAGGQEGVTEVLKNFMADLDLTMGLSGCKSISEITSQCLQRNG